MILKRSTVGITISGANGKEAMRERVFVIEQVAKRKPSGLVVIHDYEKPAYRTAALAWEHVRIDHHATPHTAVLWNGHRPDVQAVVHAHAEDILPFGVVTNAPMRPVIHSGSFIGAHVPVWDIADKFGDDTTLLVTNMAQGRDLADCPGCYRLALMRGHGFVCVGFSINDLVRLSVYIPRNARTQLAAMQMGEYKALSRGEIEARLKLDPNSPAMRRGWEYWAREAGCGHLL